MRNRQLHSGEQGPWQAWPLLEKRFPGWKWFIQQKANPKSEQNINLIFKFPNTKSALDFGSETFLAEDRWWFRALQYRFVHENLLL